MQSKSKQLFLLLLIAFQVQSFAATCNTITPFTNSNFNNLSASTYSFSGCGLPTSGFPFTTTTHDHDNLIDADSTNFSTFEPGIFCNIEYAVKDLDAADTYPAGSYVGFKMNIDKPLLSLTSSVTFSISIYNNNSEIETKYFDRNITGTDITVGFISSSDFDEIRFENFNPTTSNVGAIFKIYYPIIETFCTGANLACNEKTRINNPSFPVIISEGNTNISGLLCVGCSLNNSENVISSNTTDYATLNLPIGLGAEATFSVLNVLNTYPAGYFAGFEIENTNFLGTNLLSGITISTYLNDTLQESNTGANNLLSISSSLLSGSGKTSTGFLTTKEFDEVQIKFTSTLSVDLGVTKIYNLIIQQFCDNIIEADTTYWLSAPDFPVMINEKKSGLSDLACALCLISEMENLITPNALDFSTISTPIGVANTSSITMKDVLNTYPSGANVGLNINDLEGNLQLSLFNSMEICTYNNDTLQECKTGADLIDVNVLNLLVIGGTDIYNIGFTATKAFDEIQFKTNSLAGLLNRINVHGVFVEIRSNLLPIELLSFEVKKHEESTAEISWTTASEINNDYFVIEKSIDGVNWNEITKISGAGNSNDIKNYFYTDKLQTIGNIYYKLKQVDYDGTSSYSDIKTIRSNQIETTESFSIYPNPINNGFLNISSNTNESINFSIFNTLGQKVLQNETQNSKYKVDVSSLSSGVYFLKMNDKLIKLKLEN